jgi:aryl-alcohol dehydrogenase-like predicted oxidoreductase
MPRCKQNHLSTHIHKGNLSDVGIPGMYNAITRSLEQELIPACHRYGLDVVVYNPIAGGLFSGRLISLNLPDRTDNIHRQV